MAATIKIETPEQYRRTLEAISETGRALAKALAYQPQFQDAELIAFYRGHLARLECAASVYGLEG